MQSFLHNLGQSLRAVRRSPGSTLTILLTLTLAIGANTAIFTVDYATLLAPLPYPHPEQLVNIWSKSQGHRNLVSAGDFTDWKRLNTAFQELNIWGTNNFNIATEGRPLLVDGLEATPAYAGMLGEPFFLGRNFLPEEGLPGKERVVILTHRLWQRLGANRQILGQTIRVNGEPYTVVGVLAEGSADRQEVELIVPLVFKPEQQYNHDTRYWLVTGRLKPGVTIEQAQASMDSISAREALDYPSTNRGWGALVEPLKNNFLPQGRRSMLWLLLGAAGFLLLIACLNIANLLLAQGVDRQREIAIRVAFGASRATIFTRFLMENIVLAAVGGFLGVAVGYAVLRGLVAMIPAGTLPSEADLRLNLPVLLVMSAITSLAGVLFGCAPAWYASLLDPAEALKSGGRLGIHGGRNRLRHLLVIGEFALALPMLVGAGLMIHSLWNLTHVDLGVRTDHVLGFYLDSPSVPGNRKQINSYYRNMLALIRVVPGVTSVTALSHLPLDSLHEATRFSIADSPNYGGVSSGPTADVQTATPDYFRTFGIRIIRGRGFSNADDETSVKVAMVNETFAARFLTGLDPLNQRILMDQWVAGSPNPVPAVQWQIVGVFHTVKSRSAREDVPQIAVPFWQMGPDVGGIGVRTGPEPAAMIESISSAVSAVDSQAALALTRTMDQVRSETLAGDRLTMILFASFGAVALLLAGAGVYGLTAFFVAQRSNEIALRMALGATRSRVVSLILKEGLEQACIGSAVGLAAAYCVASAMQSISFGVPAIDLLALIPAALGLLLSALFACYHPTLRAATIEIMPALKKE